MHYTRGIAIAMQAIAENSNVSNILNALRDLASILTSVLYKANGQEKEEGPPGIKGCWKGQGPK
jgi:hypothetical protein